jgi:hypothetical protein
MALFHLVGAVTRHLLTGCGWRAALSSPSSAWFAIALAFALSLGPAGIVILLALIVAWWIARPATQSVHPLGGRGRTLAIVSLVVLARPWVPTWWDEFVWLGKARFESLGLGRGVLAALDPTQHVIPAGYPPLWPSLVGWISLGQDSLSAHVLAATLLVLLCAATALESMSVERPRMLVVAVLVAAPLVWAHARSTYVDLPVGMLGLAIAGLLLSPQDRAPLLASVIAVALTGFKDEGLAQVLAATVAAMVVQGFRKWRLAVPLFLAAVTMGIWRWLVHDNGVPLFDHALGMPDWRWIPKFFGLLGMHASDVFSWGVFWAVTLGVALRPTRDPTVRAMRVMLLLLLAFTAVALLAGPERVRVFAENGTLLNRLLLQLWPCAAVLVMSALSPPVVDANVAPSPLGRGLG